VFEVYRPGDKAQRTGVYKAIHSPSHVEPHYVTVLFGDTFPPCLTCSKRVRFELAISAERVNTHPYFRHVV